MPPWSCAYTLSAESSLSTLLRGFLVNECGIVGASWLPLQHEQLHYIFQIKVRCTYWRNVIWQPGNHWESRQSIAQKGVRAIDVPKFAPRKWLKCCKNQCSHSWTVNGWAWTPFCLILWGLAEPPLFWKIALGVKGHSRRNSRNPGAFPEQPSELHSRPNLSAGPTKPHPSKPNPCNMPADFGKLRCRNCTATCAFLQSGRRFHLKLRCNKQKTALQESGAFLPAFQLCRKVVLSCRFPADFKLPRLLI